MEEVYVLMECVQHFKPCSRTEWVIDVCKDEESVVKVVNERLKEHKAEFDRWTRHELVTKDDVYDFKEVSKNDIFKWLTNTETKFITDDYTFLTRFYEDGLRRDVWSFYVQIMPVR